MPRIEESKAYKNLKSISKHTNSNVLISRRGVPYLVTSDRKCSVAYFGKTDTYRIWEDFDKEEEKKVGTYSDASFVIDFINDFHTKTRKENIT